MDDCPDLFIPTAVELPNVCGISISVTQTVPLAASALVALEKEEVRTHSRYQQHFGPKVMSLLSSVDCGNKEKVFLAL